MMRKDRQSASSDVRLTQTSLCLMTATSDCCFRREPSACASSPPTQPTNESRFKKGVHQKIYLAIHIVGKMSKFVESAGTLIQKESAHQLMCFQKISCQKVDKADQPRTIGLQNYWGIFNQILIAQNNFWVDKSCKINPSGERTKIHFLIKLYVPGY